jgi:hypothetical protein
MKNKSETLKRYERNTKTNRNNTIKTNSLL